MDPGNRPDRWPSLTRMDQLEPRRITSSVELIAHAREAITSGACWVYLAAGPAGRAGVGRILDRLLARGVTGRYAQVLYVDIRTGYRFPLTFLSVPKAAAAASTLNKLARAARLRGPDFGKRDLMCVADPASCPELVYIFRELQLGLCRPAGDPENN